MKRTLIALFGLVIATSGIADTLEILRRIPHSGYSEGLDFHEGFLWHALPKEIVKINPEDGEVVKKFTPATEYSESLTWFKGVLWNVSFSDNGIYSGSLKGEQFAFTKKGTVPEEHAWGIAHDGKNIIITGNYSKKLYFLNPANAKVVKTIETPVKDLEDLAWDGTGIWTSSFTLHQGTIFRINPKTGAASKFFTLPSPEECPIIDGIAYDGKNLWITGKNCTSIYYVKRPTEKDISSPEKTKGPDKSPSPSPKAS